MSDWGIQVNNVLEPLRSSTLQAVLLNRSLTSIFYTFLFRFSSSKRGGPLPRPAPHSGLFRRREEELKMLCEIATRLKRRFKPHQSKANSQNICKPSRVRNQCRVKSIIGKGLPLGTEWKKWEKMSQIQEFWKFSNRIIMEFQWNFKRIAKKFSL